ncbi:hypothetical protein PIB30_065180 [Stylosanthes scabra]|uniref:Uncharacterized protein n=1 Tax=Stylosanthes scabra TaxID=79078 RepID=A0ABU6WLW8_9FABA|nr:hypothetical protein [Stylosanthes scabra]
MELFPDSSEGTQEPSKPSPRTTSSVAPIRKDTRDQEQTNTNPPPGTGGMNAPPKTPNQPRNTEGREMNDGQEASATPDREILDLNDDQEGLEIGNSGRRVFVGLGDDQSRQTQEMCH